MFLQLSLLFSIFLLLPLPLLSSLFTKEGCQDRCGNISIPFPFGIGSDCSISNTSFNLICNDSTNPPKLHVQGFTKLTEIIEINTSYVRVKYPFIVAGTCYNMSDGNTTQDNWYVIDISSTQYTLSGENWLTAIGCDDVVVGLGQANQSFGGGCVSYCSKGEGLGVCPNNINGDSNTNGCCHAQIPKGTNILAAQLSDLSGKWRREKLFPCSYAFVEEKGISDKSRFSYSLSFLDSSTALQGNRWTATSVPPVVRLDWRIGTENCSQARNATGFACQNNSVCHDFFHANVGGYLCSCSKGYKGNPYLIGGCEDIDECADIRTNPCHSNSNCINTNGSYFCSCLYGYYGDGEKHGMGCIQLPLSNIHSKVINIWIGLGIGLGFLLLLLTCFWLHKMWQIRKDKMRKQKFFKRNGGLLLQQQINEGTLEKTKLFPVKELEKATDHFNKSRILGQGGLGTVYKGMFSDGKIVAIKKSKLVDENQLQQFINEVVILSQIIHRNVVKLLGCCLETEVPLLVYEFVPNGTLSDFIHDSNAEFPVSWNKRLNIVADVAGALSYLHTASSIPIYHRDIKSSNILLDEKYIVKVSDFGTSMSFAVDQTHLTTMVKGTIGYVDPEYFQSGQFTKTSDVYSFGVVLVELLTRQKPISSERTHEGKSLVARFLDSLKTNTLDIILDPHVLEQGRKEEVIIVARLAQRCLNLKGDMRPTMKEVATELESLRISQIPSTVEDEPKEERVYEAKAIMISDNDYTWTTSGNSVSSSSDIHPLM